MKKYLLLGCISLLFAPMVLAQAYYGARPMGMGGAFTAMSDDANAIFWNPAGLAINPGVDISGSMLTSNRNQTIGDNSAGVKMCFETDLNPFAWIAGIGTVSVLAFEGAQYLSDQGVLKKNWGREEPATPKDQSMAQAVKEKGETATINVKAQAKEKARQMTSDLAQKATQAGSQISKQIIAESAVQSAAPTYPYYLPFYSVDYRRPNYWDDRSQNKQYSPQGKAQFALGLNLMSDRNENLDQNTTWYTLGIASGYEERVALGANLNLYDLYTISNENIRGFGGGLDIGGMFRPIDNFSIGLVAKEFLTTDIRWTNGASTRYPMTVNGGVSLEPWKMVTLAVDMHNIFSQNNASSTMHYGMEVRPVYGVALRGGLYDGSKTAGLSIGITNFYVDYAYLGGSFNRTQMIGVTYKM